MKNLTIRVEEEVVRWAKVHAARHGTSVSRIVGEMLKQRMEEEEGYSSAYERWKTRKPRVLKAEGATYPSRDALHER